MSVTFSSSAYENDNLTPTVRFVSFTLEPASGQVMTEARNRVVSGRPAGMRFSGPGLLAAAGSLEQIEARGLVGPRMNQAGYVEALVMEGELVTVQYTLADGVPIQEKGLITDLSINVGPGGEGVQSIDMVFHRVDRIRFIGSTLVLSAVASA